MNELLIWEKPCTSHNDITQLIEYTYAELISGETFLAIFLCIARVWLGFLLSISFCILLISKKYFSTIEMQFLIEIQTFFKVDHRLKSINKTKNAATGLANRIEMFVVSVNLSFDFSTVNHV